MSYQQEKTRRKLTCILLSEGSQSERLHTVWFQINDILEVTTREAIKTFSGCQRLRGKEGWTEEHKGFLRQWTRLPAKMEA